MARKGRPRRHKTYTKAGTPQASRGKRNYQYSLNPRGLGLRRQREPLPGAAVAAPRMPRRTKAPATRAPFQVELLTRPKPLKAWKVSTARRPPRDRQADMFHSNRSLRQRRQIRHIKRIRTLQVDAPRRVSLECERRAARRAVLLSIGRVNKSGGAPGSYKRPGQYRSPGNPC